MRVRARGSMTCGCRWGECEISWRLDLQMSRRRTIQNWCRDRHKHIIVGKLGSSSLEGLGSTLNCGGRQGSSGSISLNFYPEMFESHTRNFMSLQRIQ